MQRLISALVMVLAVGACQPAAEAPPEPAAQASFTAQDETAIRVVLEKFVVDMIAEDWTNISYYDADGVVMPPNEPMIQGRAAITEWFEALPPVTGFSLTAQVIAGDGDLAYARGVFTLDLAPLDADPVNWVGKWLAIYERQADGSWLCVIDIWNADVPVAM